MLLVVILSQSVIYLCPKMAERKIKKSFSIFKKKKIGKKTFNVILRGLRDKLKVLHLSSRVCRFI